VYAKRHKAKGEDETPTIQLVHFDVEKKESRVIVDKIESSTVWPAVSPDGKRVAVARFSKDDKDGVTGEIEIYDLQGKKVHQSKSFPWCDLSEPSRNYPCLFWSPKDDRIVVTTSCMTGCYNVRTDVLELVKKEAGPLILGGTPIRPDGKGCLMLALERGAFQLKLMQFDGSERTIDIRPLEKLLGVSDEYSDSTLNLVQIPMWPLFTPSWWDGNTAVVGCNRDNATIRFDTVAKTTAITAPRKDGNLIEQVIDAEQAVFDLRGDVSIHLVRSSEKNPKTGNKGDSCRVVAVNRKTRKEEVLLAKEASVPIAVPSPDGRYLVLSFSNVESDTPSKMLVINDKGELVAKLEIDN
jgi:Tol biopolymer transport system component